MSKEYVFITGANKGLGYESVKALLQSSERSYHIFLGSRSLENGQSALAQLAKEVPGTKSTVEVVQVDVEDDESIKKAEEVIRERTGRLDVLVNNAGAAFDSTFTNDGPNARSLFNKTFDVNVTGSQAVTYALTPLLLASPSPRLLFITSGLATLVGAHATFMPPWAPSPSAGWPKDGLAPAQAYKTVKTALNMLMLTWYQILKADGVRTWSISPGFLATDLGNRKEVLKKAGAMDPAVGGDLIRRVVEGERDEDVGKVVTQNGVVQDW